MDSSILNSIKKLLGIDESDTSFDTDVLLNINTIIGTNLLDIGVGPPGGFIVTSKDQVWSDYIGTTEVNLEGVKTYIYLKTKMVFDPPSNSTTSQAFDKNIAELEWRLMLAVETNNLEV